MERTQLSLPMWGLHIGLLLLGPQGHQGQAAQLHGD